MQFQVTLTRRGTEHVLIRTAATEAEAREIALAGLALLSVQIDNPWTISTERAR